MDIDPKSSAMFLIVVVKAVVDYLKQPLLNTPKIARWMIEHGWAVEKDDGVELWWLPYVTFLLGMGGTMLFKIDIVSAYLGTGVPVIARLLLSGAVIGVGSNILNDIASKIQRL
jgi:hypothetical protein